MHIVAFITEPSVTRTEIPIPDFYPSEVPRSLHAAPAGVRSGSPVVASLGSRLAQRQTTSGFTDATGAATRYGAAAGTGWKGTTATTLSGRCRIEAFRPRLESE
jgi:hypothetical protein